MIENLGWYDPKQKGANFEINEERVRYWRDRGAQVSNTVKSLLKRAGRARRAAAQA
jgi:small subunit ribosomal protein S16